MATFVFKCPNTYNKIQHWLDDDENVPCNEYEIIKCAACSRLHLINRKTGALLGADVKT
jgi:hypothetical protein